MDIAALEFFATTEAVADMESRLEAVPPLDRLPLLVALAWQLRQRDTARALTLAEAAHVLLANAKLSAAQKERVAARLLLVRGEVHWLFTELGDAQALSKDALKRFTALGDAIGCADALWLMAMYAQDQGDAAARNTALECMARTVGSQDKVRLTVAQAALALSLLFDNQLDGLEEGRIRFAKGPAEWHPAIGCWAEDFLGIAAARCSDFGLSIVHRIAAYGLALSSGQIKRALFAALNVGSSFINLNDYQLALEWMQRGLDMARQRGWPGSIGAAAMQTAECLRKLGRYDAARSLLREGLDTMAALAASRNYAIGLLYLGDVEFDCKEYASALTTFRQCEDRAHALNQADLRCVARIGQSRTLLALGEPQLALEMAEALLVGDHVRANDRMDVLQLLADIHASHALPAAAQTTAPSASLHYLHSALDVAATMDGYTVTGDLLDNLARKYALVGDHAQAYTFSLQAAAARAKTHGAEATKRAIALQVIHETERARADAEHHRQLSLVQAQRADVLLQAHDTLERLGAIGREITRNLNAPAIFRALDRHVHALLDATSFVIYQLEADGQTLQMVFGIEAGQAMAPHRCRIDDPLGNIARCARERQEIVVGDAPMDASVSPGTLRTRSLMYAPLLVGERLLCVLSIQSVHANAYRERELAIFRALCAYSAIALDNAAAYSAAEIAQKQAYQTLDELHQIQREQLTSRRALQQATEDLEIKIAQRTQALQQTNQTLEIQYAALKETEHMLRSTQNELVQAGRLTILGKMAAGITHEINQPLTAIRAYADNALTFLEQDQTSKVAENLGRISAASGRMGDIVGKLKGFARKSDDNTDTVDLGRSVRAATALLKGEFTRHGVRLEVDIRDTLQVIGNAVRIEQVIINLLSNALDALDQSARREVHVLVLRDGAHAVMRVRDWGQGLSEQVASNLFEPFFTTKPHGKGLGLGLAISYSIVQAMQGSLTAHNADGGGAEFVVRLTRYEATKGPIRANT